MTDILTFVSPIVNDTIATLQANLPAQITAFNATPGAPVQLPTTIVYVPWAQDPLGTEGFPVIEAACDQGTSGAFDIDNDHPEWAHAAILKVTVWHEGDRGEVASTCEISVGLAKCVLECLLPYGAMGAGVQIADPRDPDGGGRGIFWQLRGLPADLAADGRDFKKWRVPVTLQFHLITIERLAPA